MRFVVKIGGPRFKKFLAPFLPLFNIHLGQFLPKTKSTFGLDFTALLDFCFARNDNEGILFYILFQKRTFLAIFGINFDQYWRARNFPQNSHTFGSFLTQICRNFWPFSGGTLRQTSWATFSVHDYNFISIRNQHPLKSLSVSLAQNPQVQTRKIVPKVDQKNYVRKFSKAEQIRAAVANNKANEITGLQMTI